MGSVQFSTEPFNLMKKNSFKNSGLANSKAIDLSVVEGGKHGPKIVMASKVGREGGREGGRSKGKMIDLSVVRGDKHGPKLTWAVFSHIPLPSLPPSLPPSPLPQGKKSHNKPATSSHQTPLNKAFRTSSKSIKALTEKSGYRKDLQHAALARYTLLKR